jgi:hypothetical protein
VPAFDDPPFFAPADKVDKEREEFLKRQRERTESATPSPNGHDATGVSDNVRFRFTQFRDIGIDAAPPYRVHELLPRVGVVVIWGKPKCGKTFWAYDLEMHVALGWEYRGRRVERGEVLHIACEGARGLGARKEAWRLHHTQGKSIEEVAAIDNAAFHLCKDTALDLIKDADRVMADIAIQFGDRPIAIVTIDTLNRSLKGSENKDDDMAKYLSAAIAIADKFQCCVVIIHHCGHNEERPRGHSSLLGSADCLISTKKDEHGRVCTEVEEMRDGPGGAQTVSLLRVVDVTYDDNFNPITSCVIVPDDTVIEQPQEKSRSKPPSPLGQRFYAALADALCVSAAQPRSQSGGRISVTNEQWIHELARLGLIDRDKSHNTRSAISKYRRELIAANWVAYNEPFIWSIKQ